MAIEPLNTQKSDYLAHTADDRTQTVILNHNRFFKMAASM